MLKFFTYFACFSILTSFFFGFFAVPVFAAPSITGVSGSFVHGQTATISGSDFGTKSQAFPVVWDDCQGDDPLDLWDRIYNRDSGTDYILDYRTPSEVGRGVSTAHNNATKYMAGCFYPGGTPYLGSNVGVWKERSGVTGTNYMYISWYERLDPSWSWNLGTIADNNYKIVRLAYGDGENAIFYFENNTGGSYAFSNGFHITDFVTGNGRYYGYPVIDFRNRWIKFELEAKIDNSGYVKVWANGIMAMDYSDDFLYSEDTMNYIIMLGSYARDSGADTQWKYYNDIYLDYTLQRVIIGNAPSLSECTTFREIQIPLSWSDNSITVTANEGSASHGTAYLYVFDETGTANEEGYPITIGNSDITPPASPSGLIVS
ncbi:MAG TPA: hypothetical protein PLF30_04170 [Candidatus Moranbacteria bacterium]|jgi:hypothetical protein|nr:hypothetical protein [Candidatus Moranbacteria bacterium]HPX94721.1 hypothetical protein [Candidatus Moranbacteria bacterium]HQB59916.1 hypothetical protein [Candidatus Moranbacteria bacterium]